MRGKFGACQIPPFRRDDTRSRSVPALPLALNRRNRHSAELRFSCGCVPTPFSFISRSLRFYPHFSPLSISFSTVGALTLEFRSFPPSRPGVSGLARIDASKPWCAAAACTDNRRKQPPTIAVSLRSLDRVKTGKQQLLGTSNAFSDAFPA